MRKAIDLFSGCGGLTCGLKMAGFEVIACAEIRPEARASYSLNHKGTKVYGDIRTLTADQLFKDLGLKAGQLDLVAACPPCQGFSTMTTRNREVVADPRNELIFEVMRLVYTLVPKCVLIENVPKLLKDARLLRFKTDLETHGYVFSEGILNAKDFGVAQRRKRMILIGSRFGGLGLPEKLRVKRVVRDIIGGLPRPDAKHKRVLHRIRQHFSPLVEKRISSIKKHRSELTEELVLECHRNYPNGFKDVYGRMSWDEVSPTITRFSHNPSKGRFVHPEENRGLTVYEAMLLQGFPRRYQFQKNLGLGKLSSMIGEAFPPPMAAAQAKHIKRALEGLGK
jgi:DNA (cytosine-5)-methyltransferase 1